MGWFQIILVVRKIVQILIESGFLDDASPAVLADAKALAEPVDPALMQGLSFAEIIEIVQKLLPILQEIWLIIQRENGITQ